MRDSMPGWALGFALALCCALPLLLLSGAIALGGGLALNQQFLVGLGVLMVILGSLVFFLIRLRRR